MEVVPVIEVRLYLVSLRSAVVVLSQDSEDLMALFVDADNLVPLGDSGSDGMDWNDVRSRLKPLSIQTALD